MSFVKYRVKEVAADFGVTPKDIAEIVGKYFEKPRSNTQVLTDEQLNVVFDVITQKHQIASLEQIAGPAGKEARAEEGRGPEARSPARTGQRSGRKCRARCAERRQGRQAPAGAAQARAPRRRYLCRHRQCRPL
ncbi:MAG: hypothetical protein ACLSCT_05540 [Oscillospiraceae bacterium]